MPVDGPYRGVVWDTTRTTVDAMPEQQDRPSARRVGRRRRRDADVEVITDARRSRLDDWRHRRYVYAGLQLARIPLLVMAVVAYGWLHSPVLAAVFAVISLPLPWVAVLLANEKGSDEEKGQPKVYKPALARQYREAKWNAGLTDGTRDEIGAGPSTTEDEDTVIDAGDREDGPR